MKTAIILISLFIMLVCAGIAVMVRSTLKSAAALAAASIALGVVMYALGSHWAALFEVSVCSGFVTVVFISAVTMTSHSHDEQDEIYAQNKHTKLLPFLLIGGGVALIAVMALLGFRLPAPAAPAETAVTFGEELWGAHKDLLLAILTALIAGAFAVVVLFKEDKK